MQNDKKTDDEKYEDFRVRYLLFLNDGFKGEIVLLILWI
jgi:hypothetical protein